MKNSVPRAQFRQLCALGIDPPAVVPALLVLTHRLIGSECNAFFWRGPPENRRMTRTCVLLAEAQPAFGFRVIARTESALARDRFRVPMEHRDLLCLQGRFARSTRYREIFWPGSTNHTISCHVQSSAGRQLGTLVLARQLHERAFTDDDRVSLRQLQPHLALALEPRSAAEDQYAVAGATGMVTLTADGQVSHANARARALLMLAADEADTGGGAQAPDSLPRRFEDVCLKLLAGTSASPVREFVHRTQWGLFRFRCERLQAPTPAVSDVVVATIEHLEPAAIVCMRAIQAAKLSPRQMQICLMLCEPRSLDEVAAETGVALATIKDHVKTIYARFGVHTRENLKARLIAQVAGAGLTIAPPEPLMPIIARQHPVTRAVAPGRGFAALVRHGTPEVAAASRPDGQG